MSTSYRPSAIRSAATASCLIGPEMRRERYQASPTEAASPTASATARRWSSVIHSCWSSARGFATTNAPKRLPPRSTGRATPMKTRSSPGGVNSKTVFLPVGSAGTSTVPGGSGRKPSSSPGKSERPV